LAAGIPSAVARPYDSGMDELFDLPPTQARPKQEGRGRPRLQRPNRGQVMLRPTDLESLLPADHRAREVWAFVEGLDLAEFEADIKAVEGHSGRPPIDPAILTALWLYATLEGVGSARALDRLCDEHDAYRWICGGVGVNHHTLADFRVDHGGRLERLLVQSVAALMTRGEVTLARVAHDGVRVRASAGAASYRGRGGLRRALAEAATQVTRLRAELDDDPAATSRRQEAARERAAREREERVKAALEVLPELEDIKRRNGDDPESARVSTTDAEARVMRMGDGGWRPAYNGQLTTDTGSGLVCGVSVTNRGSDAGELVPLVRRLEDAFGVRPAEVLVDGGFATLPDIEALGRSRGTGIPTLRASPAGGHGWAPRWPGRSTGTGRRLPSGSTPRPATGGCNSCPSEGSRRSARCSSGTPSPTTSSGPWRSEVEPSGEPPERPEEPSRRPSHRPPALFDPRHRRS
jgi:transposase